MKFTSIKDIIKTTDKCNHKVVNKGDWKHKNWDHEGYCVLDNCHTGPHSYKSAIDSSSTVSLMQHIIILNGMIEHGQVFNYMNESWADKVERLECLQKSNLGTIDFMGSVIKDHVAEVSKLNKCINALT